MPDWLSKRAEKWAATLADPAKRALAERYGHYITLHIKRLAHKYDADLAADAALDAFFRAVDYWRPDRGTAFLSYYWACVQGAVWDRVRQEAARVHKLVGLARDATARDRGVAVVDDADEADTILRRCPKRRAREAALMHWRDGWTEEEVADHFGVYKTTIRKELADVRRRGAAG